jgi:hypothetical protein
MVFAGSLADTRRDAIRAFAANPDTTTIAA